ncbi:capsule biosynthesis GfcC family protein [Halomonas sp. ATCH28]|uniref:Capsule biosynthesis GfcC family protein n=1 Tax=Halomonas gemina TaxID=2945105 RepID=A0ABT0SXT9_9GAMM|nr:capsule biosynthesis GfcC family protein [Halomonas gemina]MCL7939474.1 capsule biosynthesis GfcC family protein [Halomonas gemina]
MAGLKHLTVGLVLGLSISQANAQTASSSTLADAWLQWQQANPAPVAWQYAFALRHDTAADLRNRRRQLIAELRTLTVSSRVAGRSDRVAALTVWRERLASWDDDQTRTPGRMDLPWLGANLRHNPPLSRIVHLGVCDTPGWVEVWSLDGVTRLDWVPDLTMDDVLDALSQEAAQDADHAAIVSPNGDITRRGVAAWNHETSPLVPGSRVMLELPTRQGLRAALPFPGTTHEADLINTRLPALLATRLPGDDCTMTRTP